MSAELAFLPTPDGPSSPSLDLLNQRQRAFVLHYLLGTDDVRGVVYKSYFAAGFGAKDKDSASAGGAALMRHPNVVKAMDEIRKELEREAKARMKSWVVMAGKAQDLLERAVNTALLAPMRERMTPQEEADFKLQATYLSANQIAVVREVLDRALGRPSQPHTHDVGEKLDSIIARLAAGRANPAALPPPSARIADIPIPEIPGVEVFELPRHPENDP